MIRALQITVVLLAAVAMTPALAHALELPGKLRLTEKAYVAMQPVYYPGFTIAGIAEPAAIMATLLLVFVTPAGTAAFWLTLAGLAALVGMHGAYWLLTHPVNNFWLKDFELNGAGVGFFAFDPLRRRPGSQRPDWIALRNRWEFSHVLRAGLALLALALLVTAVVL